MVQVTGVLLKKGNKFLLVQEKLPKVYGLWNLPAGYVNRGETLKDAAMREAEEETGLQIEVGKEIYVTNDGYAEIHIFDGRIISGELKLNNDEILDIRWFSSEEIKKLPLRDSSFNVLFK